MAQKTVAYTTGVTPGSYTSTNLTVDNQGLITAVANGGSGATNGNAPTAQIVYGAKFWTLDPLGPSNGSFSPASGVLQGAKIYVATATTISSVSINIVTNTATYTAGQVLCGIYQGGNLIASSADQSAAWQGAGSGQFSCSLIGAPIAVAAGSFDVVFLVNRTAGTFTAWSCGSNVNLANLNLSSPDLRTYTAGAALTALPAAMPAQTTVAGTGFFLVF